MEYNKVLLIDDELNILSSLRRSLVDEAYTCIFADNGQEALEILEKHEISVIVTDMKMPRMNGLQLLKECKKRYPNTVRIVMSGYTHLPQVLAAINQGDIYKFIPKPWDLDNEFIPAINEGLEYYNLKKNNERLTSELAKKNELYKNIIESTQNRFTTFQNEINKVRAIGMYVFDSMTKHLNSVNESSYILNLYKELYTQYLNILPSENNEFDVKTILSNLKILLSYDNYVDKVSLNISEDSTTKCYGNQRLLNYILHSSCKSLIRIGLNNVTLAKLLLTNDGDKGNIEYVIMGQFTDQYIASTKVQNMEKEIEIIYGFLGELCKYMNGKIIFDRIDKYIRVKFSSELFDSRIRRNS